MTRKDIINNAIATAKRDGYNQVVYYDEDGELAFSRDYPSNTMYKPENLIGKVVTSWSGGIFQAVFQPIGEFTHRFKSGRVMTYLRAEKMASGKFGIQTRAFNKQRWENNISLPLFDSFADANRWLAENYTAM